MISQETTENPEEDGLQVRLLTDNPEDELQEWLRRLAAGDKAAFGQIYEMTHLQVYRMALLFVGRKQDAVDVASEVYGELLRSYRSYKFDMPFRPWLNGVVVRQARNWNRRQWRLSRLLARSWLTERGREETPDAAELLLEDESRGDLLRLVDGLTFKLRSVVVLRYYQECSFEEIAQLLQIPVSTAKSRHRLALAALRKLAGADLTDYEQGRGAACPSKTI